MHYTTKEKVEGLIAATVKLSDAQWSAILEQTDLIVDTYLSTSYIDETVHIVNKEVHYDIFEEFQLHKSGVLMVDSVICQFRDRTGWAEHLVSPQAYKWFESGKILIASPYVNYTPNVFFVSYRYKELKSDIPRYVTAGATAMAASLILAQPRALITPETIAEFADVFGGGDVDVIKSVSIEGISVSFDTPSVKDGLAEMYKAIKDASKAYREQAVDLLKMGMYKPRFE